MLNLNIGVNMKFNFLEDLRISTDTFGFEKLGKGIFGLGFDRDGSCFEIFEINKQEARDMLELNDGTKFSNLDITDFGDARYYWSENTHDGGVLIIK